MTIAITPEDVLVVVDVQYDFLPGGSLAVAGGDEIVPLINRLATKFTNVVLTQDWHPANHISFASQHPGKAPFETIDLPYGTQVLWPDHCVWATHGAEISKDLGPGQVGYLVRIVSGFVSETLSLRPSASRISLPSVASTTPVPAPAPIAEPMAAPFLPPLIAPITAPAAVPTPIFTASSFRVLSATKESGLVSMS